MNSPPLPPVTVTVALLGNPNTGKSTLFTALAGVRQRTGNYPGVTVEKKIGRCALGGRPFELIDLPGTYSLAPRSPDELVTVDVLLGRQADQPAPAVVLCIVDAANLERNLFLVSQALALGKPLVVALNMIDVARERGLRIDIGKLQARLGVPVVAIQANRGVGLDELRTTLISAAGTQTRALTRSLPGEFYSAVNRLLPLSLDAHGHPLPEFLVERLLLDTSGYLERDVAAAGPKLHAALQAERKQLAEQGCPIPQIEAISRYGWVARTLDGVVERPKSQRSTFSDRLDGVLTHWFWGTLIFCGLMFLLFSSIFWLAPPVMDLIEAGTGRLAETFQKQMSPGPLRSLLVDGVIGGVGGVIIFLPQIVLLFMFIAILEDCGYMARAAYLMDKLMSRVGLSGKSFIPLLSSFACAIPGVMATRVIENWRDRLTTILVAPLMSCSARLPVYLLFIGAFIPAEISYLGGWVSLQSLTLLGMYAIGIFTALAVAWCLKKTLLAGETPPFVMELPAYKIPSAKLVGFRMAERGWAFLARAGTLIVAVSVLVWAAQYYPYGNDAAFLDQEFVKEQTETARQLNAAAAPQLSAALATELAEFDDPDMTESLRKGIAQRHSYLAQLGRAIEPVVRPLGWDWRIGCAALASFPAREVVIGTLGVIYHISGDVGEDSVQMQLQERLKRATWDDDPTRPVFTLPVALSIMVFFALCAQCASTLVIIKRETNSWRWPIFTFVYMTVLAYLAAWGTYQLGTWLGW